MHAPRACLAVLCDVVCVGEAARVCVFVCVCVRLCVKLYVSVCVCAGAEFPTESEM